MFEIGQTYKHQCFRDVVMLIRNMQEYDNSYRLWVWWFTESGSCLGKDSVVVKKEDANLYRKRYVQDDSDLV